MKKEGKKNVLTNQNSPWLLVSRYCYKYDRILQIGWFVHYTIVLMFIFYFYNENKKGLLIAINGHKCIECTYFCTYKFSAPNPDAVTLSIDHLVVISTITRYTFRILNSMKTRTSSTRGQSQRIYKSVSSSSTETGIR